MRRPPPVLKSVDQDIYLVPERDTDALAHKLGQLADQPHRWAEMGLAGRRRIEEAFDIEKLVDRLVELYQQLIGR